MKTEAEIRTLIESLINFNQLREDGSSIHGQAIRALEWVLGEYPPPPRERPAPPPPDPHIAQPMGPGGFAVRSFGARPNPPQGGSDVPKADE